MLNLISAKPASIVAFVGQETYAQHLGQLVSPLKLSDPREGIAYGAKWAMDNGCFVSYDPPTILRLLKRFHAVPDCLFAVAPDVVRDAELTTMLFSAWLGTFQRYGYPIAYVAQNGIENVRIPWDSFQCLFIGGDDTFKFSTRVSDLVSEAKRRGKWVHNGRVNTAVRITYSGSIGVDSFDGLTFAKWFRTNLKPLMKYQMVTQSRLIA